MEGGGDVGREGEMRWDRKRVVAERGEERKG